MRRKILSITTGTMSLVLLSLAAGLVTAAAQGTAFTYQGQLQTGGVPASGTYNLQFSLYTNSTGGTAVAGPVTNNAVAVSNGLFTVAIDFGAVVWTGQTNWLQIGVETNGGGDFTLLTPLQQLRPAPYAIYATTAGAVSGISVQPNADGAPNVIGGSPGNLVAGGVVGATISGGGATNYQGNLNLTNSVTGDFGTVGGGFANTSYFYATVGGGQLNAASGSSATVGGGYSNTASAFYATVGGGADNEANNNFATVGGGLMNTASPYATVAGGYANTASGPVATVGGGFTNMASGPYATVPGGSNNVASGICSFAAGQDAQAPYNGSFVWSDGTTYTASTAANQFVARASGGFSFYGEVGINNSSPQAAIDLGFDSGGEIIYRGNAENNFWMAGMTYSAGNFGFFTSSIGEAVAYIDTSGNYHQVSDRGLKRDITSLDNTLDRLLQLRPVSYHFRNARTNAPLSLGFIAQEVQPLFPEVVGEQTNGVKDLVYSELVPIAIRSIQELNQKLEGESKTKDAEIQTLKQQNESLAEELNELEATVKQLAAKK